MNATLKLAIKRALFPALHRLGVYDRIIARLHHHKVVILAGHRVSGPALANEASAPLSFEVGMKAEKFDKIIRFLSQEMQIISLSDLIAFLHGKANVPDRAVAIMFDDGYMDNYQYAFPILKRYQVPATIFLVTDHVDTASVFWWDQIGEILKRTRVTALHTRDIKKLIGPRLDSLPDLLHVKTLKQRNHVWERVTGALRPSDPEQVASAIELLEQQLGVTKTVDLEHHLALTWDQVQEMHRGGIDFGAHTMSHPYLPTLSRHRLTAEILGSKHAIEKHLGKPVTAFAYPYGELPSAQIDVGEVLRENDFQCAFLYEDGFVSKASHPFLLKRIGLGHGSVGMMVRELAAVLSEDRD